MRRTSSSRSSSIRSSFVMARITLIRTSCGSPVRGESFHSSRSFTMRLVRWLIFSRLSFTAAPPVPTRRPLEDQVPLARELGFHHGEEPAVVHVALVHFVLVVAEEILHLLVEPVLHAQVRLDDARHAMAQLLQVRVLRHQLAPDEAVHHLLRDALDHLFPQTHMRPSLTPRPAGPYPSGLRSLLR